MRRLVILLTLVAVVAGCSRQEEGPMPEQRPSESVQEVISILQKFAPVSVIIPVDGRSAAQFRHDLEAAKWPGVRVWMPSEKWWVLTASSSTNRVQLAAFMEELAADTNCTMSVAELFASYVGTREEILPAFEEKLEGEVVPEWFVPHAYPSLAWLDFSEIDEDILQPLLKEFGAMQATRRLLLEGSSLSRTAKDAKEMEKATEKWAEAYRRNPRDPMLLERMENLANNAKGFLEVGKALQAMKCFETIILINPQDASAIHNFGIILRRMGRKDMAEKILKRAEALSASELGGTSPAEKGEP